MRDDDISFVVYTWLASHKYSPEGLLMGAHRDKDAARRHWLGEERLAHKLVRECTSTIAEMNIDGASLIVGYVVGEPDLEVPVLHYVLTRRKCYRMGVAKDLLLPYMQEDRVLYSHRPSVRGLCIPENWSFDPYTAVRHLV